jgi:hypothetical protein
MVAGVMRMGFPQFLLVTVILRRPADTGVQAIETQPKAPPTLLDELSSATGRAVMEPCPGTWVA